MGIVNFFSEKINSMFIMTYTNKQLRDYYNYFEHQRYKAQRYEEKQHRGDGHTLTKVKDYLASAKERILNIIYNLF